MFSQKLHSISNRLYPTVAHIISFFFLLSCANNNDQGKSATLAANSSFSKPLPKALEKHETGLIAEVEITHNQSGESQVIALIIDTESKLVSGEFSELVVGSYTFTIRYWFDGLLLATEILQGEVRADENTAIVFLFLTFPDDDDDSVSNIKELEFGTDPKVPLGEFASLSSGAGHTCGIKMDSTLWCWGFNGVGQLGEDKLIPSQEGSGFSDWVRLSSGAAHTCAIRSDGSLWCWGYNNRGQLGDQSLVNKFLPVQEISAENDWSEVKAGFYHTCATKNDGTLWCWGENFWGQLGDGEAWRASPRPVHLEE